MKTKLLIITIIIGLVISSGFAFIYNEMSDCLNPPRIDDIQEIMEL